MPTEAIKVVVRKRPLNSKEQQRGNYSIISIDRSVSRVEICNPKNNTQKPFTFDAVYAEDSTQRLIYDETAFPLVDSVIEGYNGTIFAYGQTGCGKTYTMVGTTADPGIILNSFAHVFGAIAEARAKTFLVRCSYCEIYNEEIRDLLEFNPGCKLELKETKDHGIFIKNLSTHAVRTVADIEAAMESGNSHRITKETNMNERSSRSHAIFTIYIETSETIGDRDVFKVGKLNLVDLAGSERQKKTGVVGEQLREAIEINLSLSALGNVISALVDGKTSHIPYRDSKLTRLLQDSLGGNTKTVMIAVVSPADYNYDESLSTLRYASRAKFIKNKPTINEDPKDALLRQYADEITRLRQLLEQRGSVPQPQLEHLQEIVIQGGSVGEVELQGKLEAQRAFRRKLKKQKRRELTLRREKEAKEHELLQQEQHYSSLQEEAEGLRSVIQQMQLQRSAAEEEIQDLHHEFELDKEQLLDNVRALEHECDFVMKVVGFLMPPSELERIREAWQFDQNNHRWFTQPFVLQTKQTTFPKLGKPTMRESVGTKPRVVGFLEKPNADANHSYDLAHRRTPSRRQSSTFQ